MLDCGLLFTFRFSERVIKITVLCFHAYAHLLSNLCVLHLLLWEFQLDYLTTCTLKLLCHQLCNGISCLQLLYTDKNSCPSALLLTRNVFGELLSLIYSALRNRSRTEKWKDSMVLLIGRFLCFIMASASQEEVNWVRHFFLLLREPAKILHSQKNI